MTGDGPTIVKSPYNRNARRNQVRTQHRVVDVAPMQVVQMDYVRLNPIERVKERFGRPPGGQAVAIEEPRLQSMPTDVPIVSNAHRVGTARLLVPSESNVTLPPF